jgi:hypothetical protein
VDLRVMRPHRLLHAEEVGLGREPFLASLTYVYVVPVRVRDRRHPLAPFGVSGLGNNSDAFTPQPLDLLIDLVGVQPERCTTRLLDRIGFRETDREGAEGYYEEVRLAFVGPTVTTIETQSIGVERRPPRHVGGLEDCERITKGHDDTVDPAALDSRYFLVTASEALSAVFLAAATSVECRRWLRGGSRPPLALNARSVRSAAAEVTSGSSWPSRPNES